MVDNGIQKCEHVDLEAVVERDLEQSYKKIIWWQNLKIPIGYQKHILDWYLKQKQLLTWLFILTHAITLTHAIILTHTIKLRMILARQTIESFFFPNAISKFVDNRIKRAFVSDYFSN